MKMLAYGVVVAAFGQAAVAPAGASDLLIHLQGTDRATRSTAHFQCDSNAPKLGFPAGVVTVEYINSGGNSLAVLPIGGRSLIFAGVVSGSGARYAASRYTWSDGGVTRGAFLSSDFATSSETTTQCKEVK